MNNNRSSYIIGFDVASNKIDVFNSKNKSHETVTEDKYLDFFDSISTDMPDLVIMEATGSYSSYIAALLATKNIPHAIVNPQFVSHFARSGGPKAKTDKKDAKLLVEYAIAKNIQPQKPKEPEIVEFRQLLARRQQLVSIRADEKKRLQKTQSASVKDSIQSLIDYLNKEIKKIDNDLDKAVNESKPMTETNKILQSIPGVGNATSYTILAELPEIGTISNKACAALVGTAPFANDSGKFYGKRFVRGGRSAVRSSLYMAALSATRFNPVIKSFYKSLIAKGKPFKIAITACMRKLVVIMNSMVKKKQTFSQKFS